MSASTVRVVAAGAGVLFVAWLAWLVLEPDAKKASHRDVASSEREDRSRAKNAAAARASEAVDADESPSEPIAENTMSGAAREAFNRVASALTTAISNPKRFPELAQCLAQGQPANCTGLMNEAIRKSTSWPVGPDLAVGRNPPIAQLVARWGGQSLAVEARHVAQDILLKDTSPINRAAALALEERLSPYAKDGLPPYTDAVYEGLASRPHVEAYFMTRALEQQPSSSKTVAYDLSKLALDGEVAPEVRRQAIRSLGAARDGQLLEGVVDRLLTDKVVSERALATSVGPALAHCGASCGPVLQRLAQSQNESARLAVIMALTRLDPSDQVRQSLLPKLQANATSPSERNQLSYLASAEGSL